MEEANPIAQVQQTLVEKYMFTLDVLQSQFGCACNLSKQNILFRLVIIELKSYVPVKHLMHGFRRSGGRHRFGQQGLNILVLLSMLHSRA